MNPKSYSLTNPQKSILLTEQYFSETAVNTICGYVLISDKVNLSVLKKAINEVIKLNDGMRLKLKEENYSFLQYVADFKPFDIETVNLKSKDELEKTALNMASTPFIQNSDFLFKFMLFDFPNGSGGFIVNVHHLIGDSWSLGLIAKEVTTIYSQLINNTYITQTFPSYLDYIKAEENYKNSDKWIKDKEYWEKVFTTIPEIASASLCKSEQKKSISCEGKRKKFIFSKDDLNKIKSFCNTNKISVYNFFMAVYSLYVSRVSGLDDFVMGTPILNRTNFDQKHTMGMFISVAPLRININHQNSFIEFTKNILADTMSLFRHQKYSYQTILEDVRKKDSSIPNLYNIILSYQITKTTEESNGVNYSTDWIFNGNSSDELQIHLFDLNDTDLTIAYDYKTELFSDEDISDLHARILTIINQIVSNENILLKEIDVVTPEEKNRILYAFNNTKVDYPHNKTIVDLFENQVEKTPNNIALVFEEQKLTYEELNSKANQLARYLVKSGVKTGDIVGLRIEKRLEMIIGILAIIKAGSCYLPMNMAYPEDRVNYMLQDSNCRLLLSSQNLNDISYNIKRINIDLDNTSIYSGATNNLNIKISPEDLIYIIYTSGSTGKPKGAMLTHKNVVRLMKNDKYLFDFCENDVWTMFHSVAFDFSVWEMYGALLYGGKLVLVPEDISKDPKLFLSLLRAEKVTILNQTPSYFYNLQKAEMDINDNDLKIRYIIFGGEALTPSLLQSWNRKYPHTSLINMYGITETTVHVTFKNLSSEDLLLPSSNIGKPIPTLHVLTLDKYQNLLPFGVKGEMYVLGDGVFKGYLNRPELNKEKLVYINKYSNEPIYRSGDCAILHKNGDLEYKGRIDTQVKVRGFRVELGEIQNKILKHSNINKCIVCKKIDSNGRELLCAYYIKNGPINIHALKKLLSKDLPYYMIPQYFIEIPNIPINFNGKTDFNALPLPNDTIKEEKMLGPKNEIEKIIYSTYQSVIGINKFSMNSSFYDLGGDSLSAISIASKLSSLLGKDISVKMILENPILTDLAKHIKDLNYSTVSSITKCAEKKKFYPISSAQRRIYYSSSLDKDSTLYNIAGGITLDKLLDIKLLEKCFKTLINRHEILRTHFGVIDNDIVQIVDDEISFSLDHETTSYNELNNICTNFIKPFDLTIAPLFRAKVVTIPDNKMLLLLDMHHIISDGTSLSILLQELCDLYNGLPLVEKKLDYKDFALWERGQFTSKEFQNAKEFWIKQFKDTEIPLLNMPTTFDRPSIRSFAGSNYYSKIPKDIYNKINEVSQKLGITPYMLLLSVYYILLSKYTSQDDIIVGTPIAGRELPELSNMVGMFVNTLVLRNHVDQSFTFKNFAAVIKENCINSFKNQCYPYDILVKDLNIKKDSSRNPLFDVMFVFQNNGYPTINFNNAKIEYFIPDSNVSKFDLTLEIIPIDNEFSLHFEYCTKLFDENFISRLSSHYVNILTAILNNYEIKISNIDMLSKEEKNQILYEFNNTNLDYPKDKTIIELFEEQVNKKPNNIAIIFENQKLTYKELNEKSNQLATYLKSINVCSNDVVGIYLDRSIDLIVSMLAVLKVNACYTIIDKSIPEDRKLFMLENCSAKFLISNDHSINFNNINLITLSDDVFNLNNLAEFKYHSINAPMSIVYTSGSTGTPKGILIKQSSMINLLYSYSHLLNVNECSNFLSTCSIIFDMFAVEIFLPLYLGKTVILANDNEAKSPIDINRLIEQFNVDYLLATPSKMELLLKFCNLDNLKSIQLGGEALTKSLYYRISLKTNAKIYNQYGPSETTSCCTLKQITDMDNINIGKPIYNTKILILDKTLNICPIGVIGEICIGGEGVSLGYINNKKLLNSSFIKTDFDTNYIYKSGDLGLYNKDGEIIYMGRIDNQIKLRGLRIELSEIEQQISNLNDIKNCAVIYKKEEQYISAFITSDKKVNVNVIRNQLSKKLPLYMVPKYITQIDEFPITPNGKIDTNILYSLPENNNITTYIAPTSEEEKIFCEIWSNLLGVKVGIENDIFELGADSLLAINFKTQAFAKNIDIAYSDIFKYPKIKDLCNHSKKVTNEVTSSQDFSNISKVLEKNIPNNAGNITNKCKNNVLLLGATGFIGMHILNDFIQNDTGKIYCIIREKNKETAENRFMNILHFYFGTKLDKYINDRIILLKGNILKDNFALSQKSIQTLIDNVEVVINSAALVKHYGLESTFHDINVVSTNVVVSFCKKYNKRLLHISSLSVSGQDYADNISTSKKSTFSEQDLYIGQQLSNEYIKTKFEAEKTILNDIYENNLNAQILRLGNITSRFSDGVFQINPEDNAFLNKLKSFFSIRMHTRLFIKPRAGIYSC